MNLESPDAPSFVLVSCHPSMTTMCRKEISSLRPGWLPAFSRPGFLTYKVEGQLAERFELPATFARTFGFSLKQIRSTDLSDLVDGIKQTIEAIGPARPIDKLHIWNRQWVDFVASDDDDATLPEHEVDFQSAGKVIVESFPELTNGSAVASPDSWIVDVVKIDGGHWGLGFHHAGSKAQRWPGGVPEIIAPDPMISRTYLKTAEALLWSGIPIVSGDVCVEIGSSPGGSCQKLLELGAKVIAVDPADMHPSIVDHPDLTHIKKRGRDLPQKVLAAGKWLFVDTIIAPSSTLEMCESILSHKSSQYQGAIITLKMLDDEMFENIPAHIKRVQSWGFGYVKTRHLAYGRQEVCLVALRGKGVRRSR